ncbi:MAG TPA: tRNA pseudouridine(38-40) synthase TruA [Spirochaetia bacterium]|nr:MAG: tRNA pseudouridine(38-40) synthase TruA [Spirochaetes bacterium GWB1_36_13]HCL57394.1 tRNA pseudouridine(38-40) synthase TruA [Spirochaetia bacterium]
MPVQKTVRLDIAYDGSRFHGFQKLPGKRTIQGELERCLSIIYKEEVKTFGAGRTDAGVHAIHQVISYKTKMLLPPENIKRAMNTLLPEDIRIYEASYQDSQFHARFSPIQRTYVYVIYNAPVCPPFLAHFVWHKKNKIDVRRLKKTLKHLKGSHDFTSFCQADENKTKTREIFDIQIKKKKPFLFITIRGNAFLRRMIRIIVGTAFGITEKPLFHPDEMKSILLKKKRGENPFLTAPPTGLYFYKVDFKDSKKKKFSRKIFFDFLTGKWE